MLPFELLIKTKVVYKITQSLARNYKGLGRDLDPKQNLIEKSCIPINEILVSRYKNYNKIIMRITG